MVRNPITVDETITVVNAVLYEIAAGPEEFRAVAPGTIEVTWEVFGNRETWVPRDRMAKLSHVRVRVEARLKMHRLPQVLIADETGTVITLFGCTYGTFDPAAVFPASATAG